MDLTPALAPDLRHDALRRLARMPEPQVVILGGGVNGVATLRDLALNGVSAVLLDEGDFCAGASSASSRMAHGGLRYLEGREFRLVAEAARERNLLLRHAPHLVRPLPIVVPVAGLARGLIRTALRFAGLTQKSGPMSLVALKAGLMLYERFGAVERVLPAHEATRQKARFPKGLAASTRAVVRYYDGQIDNPEALVFEMLAEAVAAPDVVALNHARWRLGPDGAMCLPGGIRLRPRLIVNATGAWIDQVNARLGLTTGHVRGVKGAHLVLRHPALLARMAGAAHYFDDGRGRMVICLPLAETILMGTTEIEAAPGDRRVAEEEVDYLLGALSRLFQDIAVSRAHLVAVTTGLRPLQAGGGSATRAARDHALVQDRLPDGRSVLSLVGGKWTTFRSFAEMATDQSLALLGERRRVSTRDRRYPGAEGDGAGPGGGAGQGTTLTRRYGRLGEEIARFCAAGPDRGIVAAPGYSLREVLWLIRARGAVTLEDLVLRRTQLTLRAELRWETLVDLAGIMALDLGHDADWVAAELARAKADPRIFALRPLTREARP